MKYYLFKHLISVSGKCITEVLKKLEVDAINVLKFMSANGLTANPTKTSFIILNDKEEGAKSRKIKVGDVEVCQESSAKLLGMTIDDNQRWDSQLYGKGGTINSLNSRMFTIKRINNHIGKENIQKIVDSLYMSKLRYGLPLYGKIKWSKTDTQEKWLTDLQLNQNKMLRFLNGSKISDRISTESILVKYNLLSVNQLNAQIKIMEMWKATHIDHYPTKITKCAPRKDSPSTRAITNGTLVEKGVSILAKNTYLNDAVRAWNLIPDTIKNCETIWSAKKSIKQFVKTLPI